MTHSVTATSFPPTDGTRRQTSSRQQVLTLRIHRPGYVLNLYFPFSCLPTVRNDPGTLYGKPGFPTFTGSASADAATAADRTATAMNLDTFIIVSSLPLKFEADADELRDVTAQFV